LPKSIKLIKEKVFLGFIKKYKNVSIFNYLFVKLQKPVLFSQSKNVQITLIITSWILYFDMSKWAALIFEIGRPNLIALEQ